MQLAVLCVLLLPAAFAGSQWIYADDATLGPVPENTFIYFRLQFDAGGPGNPQDSWLKIAADSNAAVYLNGKPIMRKMTRFGNYDVRSTVFNGTRDTVFLHAIQWNATNVLVVRHFNWGNIVTFQRTGQVQAGFWMDSNIGASTSNASSWMWLLDPAQLRHDQQIVGIAGGATRIRFPQVTLGGQSLPESVYLPGYDTNGWRNAAEVPSPPWPNPPLDVETPPQSVGPNFTPRSVLAAGYSTPSVLLNLTDAYNMANVLQSAQFKMIPDMTAQLRADFIGCGGCAVPIPIEPNASVYVTFDFNRPVHGYPTFILNSSQPGVWVDFGYTEKPFDQYTGDAYVTVDGWVNPTGIVGQGYGDRYVARAGLQTYVTPDERTARWIVMTFHCYGECAAVKNPMLTVADFGVELSGYPCNHTSGDFISSDVELESIVELSMAHVTVSMSDAYVDTPGREDGQWIEDARPRALIASRWFGDASLRRVLLRSQAEQTQASGVMHPFAPSNFPDASSYDWAVQWTAAMYDDFMWTGSTATNADLWWTQLQAFWTNALSNVDARGVWYTSTVLADIRVGQHCPSSVNCTSCIITPWMISRLRWSAEMANASGRSEVATSWLQTAELMETAFLQFCIESDPVPHVADIAFVSRTSNDSTRVGFSQAGQTVAITSGYLTQDVAQAALDYAFPSPNGSPPADVTRWNNPTNMYRSLAALSASNRSHIAMAHLKERFSQYLAGSPANPTPPQLQGDVGGPLPEYWVSRTDLNLTRGQLNPAQPVDGSGSHGWCGVALLWLHEYVLGVTVTAPGGTSLRIAPDLIGLQYMEGATSVPTGRVGVSLLVDSDQLQLDIPDGVSTVQVVTPPACSSLTPVAVPPQAKLSPTPDGYLIQNPAGTYGFTCGGK